MFEEPGRAYVYFIYGMYEMLNFVTEPVGIPGAVLIRAVEPLDGLEWIERRRKGIVRRDWTNGPGRLTRALGIQRKHNRASLAGPALFVADDGFRPAAVCCSPRVGISAGRRLPWRFFIKGHPDVSPAKENQLARVVKSLN